MTLLRLESHEFKDNIINILYNEENKKMFVLDKKGWVNASQYFYNINQCYEYIKSTYGLKLKAEK